MMHENLVDPQNSGERSEPYCACCPHREAQTPCPAIHTVGGRAAHAPFCALCVSNPKYRELIARGGMPSLTQQAATFVQAAVTHILQGAHQVSPETEAQRLSVCEACPSYVSGRCSECGCLMAGAKARWRESVCPLGKWDDVHGVVKQ